jgi:4-hydroxybenzoate polyprenyltransferase
MIRSFPIFAVLTMLSQLTMADDCQAPIALPKSPLRALLKQLKQEFGINWSFIRRDMFVSLVPGILFSTTALINYPADSFLELLTVLVKDVIYFWLCITTFCLSNQINGVEEDRLNKPERPLVVGLVTIEQAQTRWYIAMVLFSLFGLITGTLGWALTWQIGCILYEYFGGARHWYFKTFLGGIGVTSEVGAAWQLAQREIPPVTWTWIMIVGLYLIVLLAVQDFRDMAGDRALGRKTMPLLFGEMPSRYIVAACFMGYPLLVHYFLMQPAGLTPMVLFWDLLLGGCTWGLAGRTLCLRNPQADHKTYVLYTVLLCLYLMSSIFVLRV